MFFNLTLFDMPDDFVHRTHETVFSNKTVVT